MKNNLLLFLVFLLPFSAFSQEKEMNDCQKKYFSNGKVSTSTCYDANNRWGVAKAFNQKGILIYERQLRKVGGHASVYFSYYENGALKTAEYSSAPDGGIQWYKSKTEFSMDGTITNEWEQSNDDMRSPGIVQKPLEKPLTNPNQTQIDKDKKPNECAVPFSSELWLVNKTPIDLKVQVWPKNLNEKESSIIIEKGKAMKAGSFTHIQFEDPYSKYELKVGPADPKVKRIYKITKDYPSTEQVGRQQKKYFYRID